MLQNLENVQQLLHCGPQNWPIPYLIQLLVAIFVINSSYAGFNAWSIMPLAMFICNSLIPNHPFGQCAIQNIKKCLPVSDFQLGLL